MYISTSTCTRTLCVMYMCVGVMGVGKEKALQFIRSCKSHDLSHDQSRDILDQFRAWRRGSITEGCDHLTLMSMYIYNAMCV